jgi:hypothetical protein
VKSDRPDTGDGWLGKPNASRVERDPYVGKSEIVCHGQSLDHLHHQLGATLGPIVGRRSITVRWII